MTMDDDKLDALEKRLGHVFSDRSLLLMALTHTSYAHEAAQQDLPERAATDNYERFEFLGDAVIDLVVSDLLIKRYPEASEGELSRLRAGLVCCERLAALARELEVGGALLLGRGEEATGGRDKPSILSDVFEALVAAIYLDAGFRATFDAISEMFSRLIETTDKADLLADYKTPLQEKVQALYKTVPRYRIVSEQGPDHEKTFLVEISVNGESMARGEGRSKKEAEQDAARQVLESGRFDD